MPRVTLIVMLLATLTATAARADEGLREALLFHAPFDGTPDAVSGGGDLRLYTTPSGNPEDGKPGLGRKDVTFIETGRHGGALHFVKKSKARLYFLAEKNVAYKAAGWEATFSLWLRLDPQKDLEPGYSDPFQITDKKWNDASLFLDFSKDDTPRHFRLGAFSDFSFWNPQKRNWDDIPAPERPLVTVERPPFSRYEWTHVAVTCANFNTAGKTSEATLYLNGKRQGTLKRPQTLTWDLSKTAMFLGIDYIGGVDDFAVFTRALNPAEVASLYKLDGGVKTLSAAKARDAQ